MRDDVPIKSRRTTMTHNLRFDNGDTVRLAHLNSSDFEPDDFGMDECEFMKMLYAQSIGILWRVIDNEAGDGSDHTIEQIGAIEWTITVRPYHLYLLD
jgi:hypothetical protein